MISSTVWTKLVTLVLLGITMKKLKLIAFPHGLILRKVLLLSTSAELARTIMLLIRLVPVKVMLMDVPNYTILESA